jgi:GR25 family glycosyltransferase involved in LPS biosynthesis
MLNQVIIILIIVICFIFLFFIKKKTDNRVKVIDLNYASKYIINLDKRKDRLEYTSYLLKNKGYDNIIRYPAVDGQKITYNELLNIVNQNSITPILEKKRKNHNELSWGAVGCYLSHAKLWEKIEQEEKEYAVIFEDDTNPTITKNDLEQILIDVPNDWDIILLGCIYYTNPKEMINQFYKVDRFFCTHAYIINKKAIKKIKNKLYPIKDQIDWYLSDLSEKKVLNIYSLKNNNWYQNNFGTDIQTPLKV